MRFKPPAPAFFAAFLTAILFLRLLAHAWVADDAYITFRVVDNISHGLGPVWNPGQRVQAYTHPLWLLLHLPFHALLGDIYHITIILSLACFAGAFALAARAQSLPPAPAATALALFFLCSVPITDFAVSGLENPLSMLLIAAFAYQLRPAPTLNYTALSLITALLVLNRIDLALIAVPFWLWQLTTRPLPWKKLLPGASLLCLWFGFSLLYYGALFPNTKYAKLNTGIPAFELLQQGGFYLLDLAVRDLFSVLLLLFAVTLTLSFSFHRALLPRHRARLCLAQGASAYCAYVLAVGGDFMGGRFWAVPLFTFTILLPDLLPARLFATPKTIAIVALSLGAATAYSTLQRHTFWDSCPIVENPGSPPTAMCSFQGIVDERAFYASSTALFPPGSWLPRREISGYWVESGQVLKAAAPAAPQRVAAGGMSAFTAGPKVTFIDQYALADALLARLPMVSGPWRVGHYERSLPEGYAYAVETGDASRMEPELAELQNALTAINTSPLFDSARLHAIKNLNTGYYHAALAAYVNRHCQEFYAACNPR